MSASVPDIEPVVVEAPKTMKSMIKQDESLKTHRYKEAFGEDIGFDKSQAAAD